VKKRLLLSPDESALEAELLALVKRKDPAAFDALYQAYYRRLRATTIHFLGHQDPEGEDLVQETFTVAMRKLPRLKVQTSLYAWLNRVCALLCFERLRQRKRLLSTDIDGLRGSLELASPAEGALDALVAGQRRQALRAGLGRLAPPCRRIVELRDIKGLSYAQISLKLKVPMGTVMSRLLRCRQALKEIMRAGEA
jgi:RNA polymerase sigma-70 factor (ECF subfamily)